ncbi:MAG: hypothetical protein ACI9LO_001715 [Planctomycetota bacterium]|jgi:hypothetical protein
MPEITCILPGLFDLPLDELDSGFVENELPQLNYLLSMMNPLSNTRYTIDAMIRDALGSPDESGLPLATAQGQGQREMNDPGRSILFQGVHLKADISSAVILPIHHDAQFESDIEQMVTDLGQMFKTDFDISSLGGGLFLMALKDFDVPKFYPHPLSVIGKTANPFIHQSRSILPWYQLNNEMQMYLHQHDINQRRLLDGALPINSLWFWGAGEALSSLPQKANWYCDDVTLNQFAEKLGMPVASIAAIDFIAKPQDSIIIDLRLINALKAGVEQPLPALLQALESSLFALLADAYRSRQHRIFLRSGFHLDFKTSAFARYQFWRPARDLNQWLVGDRFA